MRFVRPAAALLALAAWAAPAAAATAQTSNGRAVSDADYARARADCEQDNVPSRQIAGCTVIIEQKREPDIIGIAYSNRGYGYWKTNDPDRAIADYTEAVRLSPDYFPAWFNRADAYFDRGEIDKAIADYSEILKRVPQFPSSDTQYEALIGRAESYMRKQAYDEALNDFNGAVLHRKTAAIYKRMAEIFTAQGKTPAAYAHYQQALKVAPDDAEARKGSEDTAAKLAEERATRDALFVRAEAALRQQDYERSIADYNDFFKRLPSFPQPDEYAKEQEAYIGRGTAYLARQDFAKAASDLGSALIAYANKNKPELYKARGKAYLGIGEAQDAYTDFEKSLRLAPDDAEAARGRDDALAALTAQREASAKNPRDLLPQVRQDPMTNRWYVRNTFAVTGDDIQSAMAWMDIGPNSGANTNVTAFVYFFGPPRAYASFKDPAGRDIAIGDYAVSFNPTAFHVQGEEEYTKDCGKPTCPFVSEILFNLALDDVRAHAADGYVVTITDQAGHALKLALPGAAIAKMDAALKTAAENERARAQKP